ncbi:BTAD domain-containing putative transcriptional regulator [Nonomuraea insulae]|uniref:BTAD domain-containing putative transcriptional regulator n=1 Tax=Nonomuraea insulae TaxID=1616787 RepID=A0ABW1DES4_9ACTN
MLLAKVAAPMPELRWPAQFSLEGLGADTRLRLLVPEGYLVEGRLAADLLRAGRGLGWLRPEPYELGPEGLRRLAAACEPAAMVVIQQPLPELGGPSPALAASEVVLSPCAGDQGLGVGAGTVAAAAEQLERPLTRESIDRLVAITGGRSAVIDSVLRAAWPATGRRALPGRWLDDCVMRSGSLADLVAVVTLRLLRDAEPARLQALSLAARLGYAHEDLSALRPALREPDREPWWEPLTGGWYRMLPFWSTAICALRPARSPAFGLRLARLTGELVGTDAVREAVELSRRAGDQALLAELLAETGLRANAEEDQETPPGEWEAWHRTRAALATGRLSEALEHGRKARDLATGQEATDRIRHALRLTRRTMRARSARKRIVLMLRAVEAATWPHPVPEPYAPHVLPPARRTAPPPDPRATGTEVEAWLLGSFRMSVDERPVTEWSGKLGRAVLMYLLLSRPKPVRRDVVIDAIWPGVPEGAARNRLNAAMHALRADLRRIRPDRQIVVYDRESYALAPGSSIWLDTEAFAEGCARAARLRRDGEREEAIACHEATRALYAGDLLEDAPYLDWVVPERERLSAAHVDLLDGLAALYLEAGAYAKCVDTCRQVLVRDSCRERTHCLLMRCHARQNQPHKALAQYETCRRELDAVLGMTPGPETRALYESLRRHLTI